MRAQTCDPYPFLLRTGGRINNGAQITGDLGVNDEGGYLTLGQGVFMADGTIVAADSLTLLDGTSVYDVSAFVLAAGLGVTIRGDDDTPSLPLTDPFCPIPPASCGSTDVLVSPGSISGPLPPGTYGRLIVGGGGTLVLAPGSFEFCLVKTARSAIIRTTGPTQSTIDVVGNFRLSNGGFFGPDVGTPPPVVRVGGSIVRTSAGTVLRAFVSAPNAVISIGREAVVQGEFCAASARTDKNITLACLADPSTTSTTVATSTTVTTSTTTTTIPPSCGDAETAGLAKFPTQLPVQGTCKTSADGNAQGCNDWKVIGAEEYDGGELAVDPKPARFYYWKDNATGTTCYYLYRGFGTAQTANGVHCYFSTCYVCAWDIHCWSGQKCNGADEKTAVWNDLKPADGTKGKDKISDTEEYDPIEPCSMCHATGPIAPMSKFKNDIVGNVATDEQQMWKWNRSCSGFGGPQWIGAPGGWVQQNPARHVDPPNEKLKGTRVSCGDSICHREGFAKGASNWCSQVLRPAMTGPNGAMKGYRFEAKDAQACKDFATAMGCDPTLDMMCPP